MSVSARGTPRTDVQVQAQFPARGENDIKRYELVAAGVERLLLNRGGTWDQLKELLAFDRNVLAGYQGFATPDQVGDDGTYRCIDRENTRCIVLKITNEDDTVYCECIAFIDPKKAVEDVKKVKKKRNCVIC